MKANIFRIKHTLVPCFLLSGIAGIFTGCLIFLFKVIFTAITEISNLGFTAVRSNPLFLPLLILGVIVIGGISAFILTYAKDCRGGGIPTAIASIRALIPLQWIQGVFVMFTVSMLTYLGGVPLGNEGPSVQIGTAVGKGTTDIFGKGNRVWQRYVMTGGACAGFATATCAPFTGIIFAMEEIHRRFSPMIFISASTAVLSGTVTQNILSDALNINVKMFSFDFVGKITLAELPVTVLLGIICAIIGTLFTILYNRINSGIKAVSKRTGFTFTVISVFMLSAILGFHSPNLIGSGHTLIHNLATSADVWYLLAVIFVLRVITMISANTAGISGGVFLPILTFGAIIGSLFAQAVTALGLVSNDAYPVLVATGMVTFWAVTSRTPLSAIAFSLETLCEINAVLPIAIAVTFGYITAEISGIPSFNDTIIEHKVERQYSGKAPLIVDTHLSVCEDSFAVGREVWEILWPPTCTILSVDRKHTAQSSALAVGDVLHLHYATYEPEETISALKDILGSHTEEGKTKSHLGTNTHTVPLE